MQTIFPVAGGDSMAVDNLLAALMGQKESFRDNLFAREVCRCGGYHFPLDNMFADHFGDAADDESLRALSLLSTLYLSLLCCGFPHTLFRSSVTFLRENVSIYSFNCTHYDKLYAHLTSADSVLLPLFEDVGRIVPKEVTQRELFETFDFLTNGI